MTCGSAGEGYLPVAALSLKQTFPLSVKICSRIPCRRSACASARHTGRAAAATTAFAHTTNREWSSIPVTTLTSCPPARCTRPSRPSAPAASPGCAPSAGSPPCAACASSDRPGRGGLAPGTPPTGPAAVPRPPAPAPTGSATAPTGSATAPTPIPRLIGQHSGQAAFRKLDSGQQFWRPLGNEPGHDLAGPVPLLDLGHPIRGADRPTVRRSRQIAVPQGIAECTALIREEATRAPSPRISASRIAFECRATRFTTRSVAPRSAR